jgi:transcriptional antiterminator NusG
MLTKDILKESFVPKRERKKKFNGKWKVVTEKLFPGYVFIITEQPQELFFELKNIPQMTKLLCDGDYFFIPLSKKEVDFVSKIGNGRNDHTVKISTVDFEEGDTVTYIEGDLECFEGQIKRFDKRKRQAVVEIEMFGRKTEVYLGFEFLKKK